jgi:methionyl-tRNA formyltransferase
MPLTIVMMGTGEFAVPPFRAVLRSEHRVAAVVTQPDRTGRGHHQHVNVVKELATAAGVAVLQPEKASDPGFLNQLRALQPDVILVAAYGQILKRELLAIPRLGAFNLHGSLLPRHRGAAPVQYSIWKGDAVTGVTLFRIEPALDSGPVVGMVETPIEAHETSGRLMLRLAELCVPMTLDVLGQLERGTAEFRVQDPSGVTLAPKIQREDGVIRWSDPAKAVDCHVRAMQPWPKATTTLMRPGQSPLRCLIWRVDPKVMPSEIPVEERRGLAVSGRIRVGFGRLFVAVGDGWMEVLQLQVEGRKPVDGRSFVNGLELPEGSRFE